jgi:hypothetical protein
MDKIFSLPVTLVEEQNDDLHAILLSGSINGELSLIVDENGCLSVYYFPDDNSSYNIAGVRLEPEDFSGSSGIMFDGIVNDSAELELSYILDDIIQDHYYKFRSRNLQNMNIFKFIMYEWGWHENEEDIDEENETISDLYRGKGHLEPGDITNKMMRSFYDYVEYFEERIVDECKASGVVDLKKYVEEHFNYQYSLGSVYSNDIALLSIETGLKHKIINGKLDGFLNTEKHELRHKSMLIQEQKIIQYNVQLDFNQLLQQLGNKGIVLTSIQCNQCGASCSLPKDESSSIKCESCGNIIKVTDVFEKFKNLLN